MLAEILKRITKDKRVLILGFGKEGQSSYQYIRDIIPDKVLYISDRDEKVINSNTLPANDKNTNFILGPNYLETVNDFDIIIKSPGIKLNPENNPSDTGRITSQSDLFLKAYSKQLIGVTGTKGKSTTASLIYHIMGTNNKNVLLNGNIGIPPFDVDNKINSETTIVMELSAHQLESVNTSPHISVLLNIYLEHLDHFGSIEKYKQAKLNIARFQKSEDHLIIPKQDPDIDQLIGEYHESKIHEISTSGNFHNIEAIKKELPLRGEHNLAAFEVCKIKGLSNDDILYGIKTFTPLEHRMEFAGEYNEIKYYNDSISTIPESTIHALKAIRNINTLILGGYDRGISYQHLIKYIADKGPENIILTGKVGKRIYDELKARANENQKLYYLEDFVEVVKLASKVTHKGYVCLFSPAAASYDQFKNFEERGHIFKELISGHHKK